MKVLALAILLCTVYQVSCARTMKLTEWDMRSDDSKVWRRIEVYFAIHSVWLRGILTYQQCETRKEEKCFYGYETPTKFTFDYSHTLKSKSVTNTTKGGANNRSCDKRDTDPFYSKNLKQIPSAQFDVPWWFRTNLTLPASDEGQTVRLTFEGINYKANVFLNGDKIGKDIEGAFSYFDFDITSQVSWKLDNVLEVQVYRPHDPIFPPDNNATDLSISFIDWSPHPPDGSMGIWRDVLVTLTGPVSARYPLVETTKLSPANDLAELNVLVELENNLDKAVTVQVSAFLDSVGTVTKHVILSAKEVAQCIFSPTDHPVLRVKNPQLWWPWQMGNPALHQLTITVTATSGAVSDTINTRFGIRTVSDELSKEGYRFYKVNGNPILIRGAGWTPDLFLRTDRARQRAEMSYIRHMNLNAVRLEGKFDDDEFFDLCDEFGVLTLPGWACCDAWQHWKYWSNHTMDIAKQSLTSQVKRLRIHPSVLVFFYSSDELPPTWVESTYLNVFKSEHWPNCIISSASDRTSPITGPTGVKMSGPYSWEPPNYFYGQKLGGAFGFLTEGGPGENPLTLESMLLTIPKEKLWPMNDFWDWHCGNPEGVFRNLRFFTPPLEARYGTTTSAEDYLKKSQVMVYESHRAMYEAYTRNGVPKATGLIQWMLNNPWPENVWHLYDYYLNPSASYFATRKACEPLHILYSYDDHSIWIRNSFYFASEHMSASVQVYSLEGKVLYEKNTPVPKVEGNSGVEVEKLHGQYLKDFPVVFVKLQLLNNVSKTISSNFYWISGTTFDELEYEKSTFYRTPCKTFTDFTPLQNLPKVELRVSHSTQLGTLEDSTTVNVSNPTDSVAFFIRLLKEGKDVWPILWEDNYFSLTPHESIAVNAIYPRSASGDVQIVVEVWNNIG